ncbi:MAG: hypothetical protein Q7J85_09500, partial [Bacillota bacterium]|nr:hypothetical protein [Bacillota bacterium]
MIGIVGTGGHSKVIVDIFKRQGKRRFIFFSNNYQSRNKSSFYDPVHDDSPDSLHFYINVAETICSYLIFLCSGSPIATCPNQVVINKELLTPGSCHQAGGCNLIHFPWDACAVLMDDVHGRRGKNL